MTITTQKSATAIFAALEAAAKNAAPVQGR